MASKYLTYGGLAYFLEKIRGIFAPLVHTHEIDDVNDLREELSDIRTSIARTYYAGHFQKNQDGKDTYTVILPIEDISQFLGDIPTDETLLYKAYMDEEDTDDCMMQLPLNADITDGTITL